MDIVLKKSVRLTVLLVLIIAVVLAFMRQGKFALGFLVSAAWAITNFLLLMKILDIALLRRSREKLFLMLAIKFPLLYLTGFLIITCKFFPVNSLLLGLGSMLFLVGAMGVWPKHT
jgi:uncharacterized membrane protein